MTWPGLHLWIPYVGLVAKLPREYYDPSDPHKGRPAVVVKVMLAERACVVVTRTTEVGVLRPSFDIVHQIDLNVGCDHQGWWQVHRAYRVPFSAFDDEDVEIYQRLDDDTLTRVLRAYEGRS